MYCTCSENITLVIIQMDKQQMCFEIFFYENRMYNFEWTNYRKLIITVILAYAKCLLCNRKCCATGCGWYVENAHTVRLLTFIEWSLMLINNHVCIDNLQWNYNGCNMIFFSIWVKKWSAVRYFSMTVRNK